MGGPIPVALPRTLFPLPIALAAILGLRENDEDAGVVAVTPSGDEEREEPGVADRSRKEVVEDSRSFDGILDCELVEGE